MNAEETREQKENSLHFDAHEFDGLREALEREAEGIMGRLDQFVRENPMLCIGIAAAAGFTVGMLTCRTKRDAASKQEPVDSRRM